MFPMPVEKWKPLPRRAYQLSLPIALVIWLLPMIAVMVTSIRSTEELSEGNYWGWPKHFALIENYREAFSNPYVAAGRRLVDSIIEPSTTRRHVAQVLEYLHTKRELRPPKKHGLMPL